MEAFTIALMSSTGRECAWQRRANVCGFGVASSGWRCALVHYK